MKYYLPFLILFIVCSSGYSQTSSEKFPVASVGFVENKGQVRDQNSERNNDVKFVFTDGTSFSLQLKNDGFSYQLFKSVPAQNGLSEAGFGNYDPEEEDYVPSTLITQRIDVKLIGANPDPKIEGIDQSETVFNFYTTGDAMNPILNVPSFSSVVYRNIYPNIDLVFTSPNAETGASLEYSWIVRKGGSPSKIQLAYDGADGLVKNSDGTISIFSPNGIITEGKLISYWQTDQSPVASSCEIHGNRIHYNLPRKIDQTLVIDPNIIWAVDYGGEGDEFVSEGDLALDTKGNTVITGNTESALYIATTGAYKTTFSGGAFDAFLAKMNSLGKLSWATYFGGTEKDEGHAVATDKTNNIYLAGITHSASGIATTGTYRSWFWGSTDAFLAKFTSSGQLTWSTYVGGSQEDQINALTCDLSGNIYFAGYTTSDSGIATVGAYQDSINNQVAYGGDCMLGEFRSNCTLAWASYLGGPSTDRAHAICLGNKKELYIQGTCESTTDFASGAVFQTTYGGGPADAFVAKWDTNGKFNWCSYYGGEGDDHGRGVVVDQFGDLYIIGWTDSDSAMGTPGSIYPKWHEKFANDGSGLSDGYVAKFHNDGTRVWGTYYGGTGSDQMKGIVIDRNNSYVYAAGLASSSSDVATPGAFQETLGGSSDGMLLKTDYAGNRIWGTYMGDTSSDKFQDIEKDPQGNIYCLMEESGRIPYITPGTNLTTYRGKTDAVVFKIAPFDACYDQYEPNETTQGAKKITAYKDTSLYGFTAAISNSTDQDWYKIKVTPNSNLKVILTDLTKDYNLKLFNSNNQLAKSSANTGTADEKIIFNNIPQGTYTLQINHSPSVYDPNGCYRFQVLLKSSPWAQKQNEVIDDPTLSRINANASFLSDHFNLNIISPIDEGAEITLFNAFAQPLYITRSDLNSGSQTFQVPASNLPAGLYFIKIKTDSNEGVVVKVVIQK